MARIFCHRCKKTKFVEFAKQRHCGDCGGKAPPKSRKAPGQGTKRREIPKGMRSLKCKRCGQWELVRVRNQRGGRYGKCDKCYEIIKADRLVTPHQRKPKPLKATTADAAEFWMGIDKERVSRMLKKLGIKTVDEIA